MDLDPMPTVTPVVTPWGTYEVSTTRNGHTVAFGPDGDQVDFGYAEHEPAVNYMSRRFAAREGVEYSRVNLGRL